MLVSKIIGDNYQIYIKKFNKDGKDVYTFDKVDKDKVAHLCREDAKELIDSIFNTEKKYLKNENGYDIYLDKNEFKRYYKDGVEDYSMFYINNGVDATVYLSDEANEKEPRVKSFKLGKGLKILIYGVLSMSIVTAPTKDLVTNSSAIDEQITSNQTTYEQIKDIITYDQVRKNIYASQGISEDDKNFICNEDYLKFIIETCDDPSKSYDLNERFSDITIETFDLNENRGYFGCYISGTSTICLPILDDENVRRDIFGHEFSHLCQANFKYIFIAESLAEMMSYEYLNCIPDGYPQLVNRTKILIEIIGTKPILNAVYSKDTTLFEDSIKQYLNPSEAEELLNLFQGYQYQNHDKEMNRIDELLKKMIENKYIQTNNKEEKELNLTLMEQILAGNAQYRVYFNDKNPRFYKKLYLNISDELISKTEGFYNEKLITSKGTPNNVKIKSLYYYKDNMLNYLENPNFIKFIKKFDYFAFCNTIDDKTTLLFEYDIVEGQPIKKICYDEDGNIINSYNIYSNEVLKKNIQETLLSNDISFIYGNADSKVVNISWDEFNRYFIAKESTTATFYYDNYIGELTPLEYSLYKTKEIEIPSYYDKIAVTVKNRPSEYVYLEKSIQEIIEREYFDDKDFKNISGVKNAKRLMELFGPNLIYSTFKSNDSTLLENQIRNYLDETKTKDLLNLLKFNNYEEPDLLSDVNEKIFNYLVEIRENKNKIEHRNQENDFIYYMFGEIYENGAIDRFYFNKNDERYYNPYEFDQKYAYKSEKIIGGYNESLILSQGTPESIYITSANLNKDKFIKLIENPKYYDFIKNNCDKVYTNIYTEEGKEIIDLFNYAKNDGGFVRNNNYDKQIRDFTDKKNIPDYTTFKNDLLDFLNNTDIEINNIVLDFGACPLSLDELNSLSFLLTDKYSITFKYDDTHYAYITYNKDDTDDLYTYFSEIRQLQIPSIPEKFGEIDNSYTDDTNTINKAK
jgi:hypothetical protein